MEQLKIHYTAVLKNKSKPWAKYYGRIRQGGRIRDVDLQTRDPAVAERWVRSVRRPLEEANDLIAQGKTPPAELIGRILTVDSGQAPAATTPSMTVKDAVSAFLVNLDVQGRSVFTQDTYKRALNRVLVGYTGQDASGLRGSFPAILGAYRNLSSNTKKIYNTALREFTLFLEGRGVLPAGSSADIPKVKPKRKKDRVSWTRQEMDHIIACTMLVPMKSKEANEDYHDWFMLMSHVGCRQGESGCIRWRQVCLSPNQGAVTFTENTTKSGKDRTVPLGEDMRRVLEERREDFPDAGPDDYVFPRVARTTQQTRYAVLRKAMRLAGIKKGNLHCFRHSVAEIMYKSTTDMLACAELLGHNVTTCQQYYMAAHKVDDLRKLVDANPVKW